MREFVLILPDLYAPEGYAPEGVGSLASAPAALSRGRFAPARALSGGWRGWFAACLGRADAARVDAAAVIAAGEELGLTDLWVATPLNLQAGMNTVHVPAQALLQLDAGERRELLTAFAAQFADRGLALHESEGGDFLLSGLALAEVATVEPDRLIGTTLEQGLPTTIDGAPLRALMSEIEMWLYALPLNARRERAGVPPISTLWLWGGGHSPREPLACSDEHARARFQRIHASETWIRSLVKLAGLQDRLEQLPVAWAQLEVTKEESVCVVIPLAARGLLAIDTQFVAPAMAALGSGGLDRLVIAANDRAVELRAADRWRLWRPARDWLGAVVERAS